MQDLQELRKRVQKRNEHIARKNTLWELRKKDLQYFRHIGIIRADYGSRKKIEYAVQKTYEALPKALRAEIEDPEQAIKVITNAIIQSGKNGEVAPYVAFFENAYTRARSQGKGTLAYIWTRFKAEEPQVYSKFNSYMYRQGLSAVKYWQENVALSQHSSMVETVCELPQKASGVSYTALEINYDFSGQYLEAFLY